MEIYNNLPLELQKIVCEYKRVIVPNAIKELVMTQYVRREHPMIFCVFPKGEQYLLPCYKKYLINLNGIEKIEYRISVNNLIPEIFMVP